MYKLRSVKSRLHRHVSVMVSYRVNCRIFVCMEISPNCILQVTWYTFSVYAESLFCKVQYDKTFADMFPFYLYG